MYSMSSGPNAMNFHVCPALGVREVLPDDDGRWGRVEVLLDVIEPQNPARGRHVQRAVSHRDAIGLIETGRDHHDPVGLVVAVAIDDRVHLAGGSRSDEHGALRTERHRAGVRHVLGKHVSPKTSGKHQLAQWRRGLRGVGHGRSRQPHWSTGQR